MKKYLKFVKHQRLANSLLIFLCDGTASIAKLQTSVLAIKGFEKSKNSNLGLLQVKFYIFKPFIKFWSVLFFVRFETSR